MADANAPQSGGMDKGQLTQYLVPAAAAAAVIMLAGLVFFASGSERKMSDGSNGSVNDPGLKEASAGVRFRDLKEGTGDPCPVAAEVTIHYTGWQDDGVVFDSTREGSQATGQPTTFKLTDLILGWQEGIPGMKRGGVRKLVISPDKGYGPKGKGKILPNSTLIFEIELVDFKMPRDLTRLTDGTAPGADDPGLQPIGEEGLKYRDVRVGTGTAVKPGGFVVVQYTGWLTNGTIFDSSYRRSMPASFDLGGQIIKGWKEGLPGMKPGGIRKLVIPASLAYGAQDKGDIPPNSTLVFEIELIETR